MLPHIPTGSSAVASDPSPPYLHCCHPGSSHFYFSPGLSQCFSNSCPCCHPCTASRSIFSKPRSTTLSHPKPSNSCICLRGGSMSTYCPLRGHLPSPLLLPLSSHSFYPTIVASLLSLLDTSVPLHLLSPLCGWTPFPRFLHNLLPHIIRVFAPMSSNTRRLHSPLYLN